MLATVLVLWCLAAVVVAPIVGLAIRRGQSGPEVARAPGLAKPGQAAGGRAKPSQVVAEVA